MIYCVENETREVYEARPIGPYVMVRPIQMGLEYQIERLNMLDFNQRFDVGMGKFLIPHLLTTEDELDAVY